MENAKVNREKFPTSEKRAGNGRVGRWERPPVGQYLFVPYEERNQASELGAIYDPDKKAWYVPAGSGVEPFAKWTTPPLQKSDIDIQEEFADFCASMGLALDGLPKMDGEWHGAPVTTSKNTSAKKGRYIFSRDLDGGAHGFVINNDNGDRQPWVLKGEMASEEDREKVRQLMEANRRQREEQLQADRQAVSVACTKRWNALGDAKDDHSYLVKKGVKSFGLRQDGDKLITPIRDDAGVIWSLQSIDGQGNKLYVGGGVKSGHFHILGDLDKGRTVLFGEGYATCASLHMDTGLPVVEVFDAANIEPVVAALSVRLRDKDRIICGDDDVITHSRVVDTINKQIQSEYARDRLKLAGVEPSEVKVDGVARPLKANSDCTLLLQMELSPQGVQRVVGEVANAETKQSVKIKIVNVGREKALHAAEKYDLKVVFPVFKSLEGRPTDYNDLHDREGGAVVRRQIGRVMMMERGERPDAEQSSQDVAMAALGSLATVHSAETGRQYVGPVIGKTNAHVVQDVGRLTAVEHHLDRLDKVPQVGQRARITYTDGRGTVQADSKAHDGVSR